MTRKPLHPARYRLAIAAISFILLLLSGQTAWAEPSGHQKRSLTIQGQERAYYLYAPSSLKENAFQYPLIIALHGGGSSPERLIDATQFSTRAREDDMIVAYPVGTGDSDTRRYWNARACCSSAQENLAADEEFIEALLTELVQTLPVDRKRIYIAGFSNGGMLAYRLASRLGDRLAAVGVVAGAMFDDQPRPIAPVSIIMFHGLADNVVPAKGGIGKKSGMKSEVEAPFKPISDIHQFWLQENKCQTPPEENESGNITTLASHHCAGNVSVVLNTIRNCGHNWPGASQGIYSELDDGSFYLGFSATAAMLSFFDKHPREE
ncbi:MAG: alpha/beta fold hydrolase [Micavibrio aeruginosavorus]|uniref:Alpha/beta fold hydrolase n=1 Tax=Micavibrio aeruginosavorus TaxID=349221 RepID=A0A7T5UGH9_9BACT|nr:MAG: alpha/beta fold hydrolase [Micavibrio aeruginosavorus]